MSSFYFCCFFVSLLGNCVADKLLLMGGFIGNYNATAVTNIRDTGLASANWSRFVDCPTARAAHRAIEFDGKIYSIGGIQYVDRNGRIIPHTIDVFDLKERKWLPPSESPPSMKKNRSNFGVCVWKNQIYAFGGQDPNQPGPIKSIETFNSRVWTILPNVEMPDSIGSEYAFALLSDAFYIVGGFALSSEGLTQRLQKLNMTTMTWHEMSPMTTACAALNLVALKGKLYAFGGLAKDPNSLGFRAMGEVEIYDPSTDTWSHAANLSVPRYNAAAVAHKGLIYVVGGIFPSRANEPATDVMEVYDPNTNRWTQDSAPARYNAALLVLKETNGKLRQSNEIL